jgi:hypothetical protein
MVTGYRQVYYHVTSRKFVYYNTTLCVQIKNRLDVLRHEQLKVWSRSFAIVPLRWSRPLNKVVSFNLPTGSPWRASLF